MAEDTSSNTLYTGRNIHTLITLGLITKTYMPPMHFQTSIFQTLLRLDNLQYKEAIEILQTNFHPHFTLASYTYYYHPSLQQILQIFDNDLITQFFAPQISQTDPLKHILALLSLAMSCSSSPISIPSHSLSLDNSTGNTPYIITSPPPESITSTTSSE